MLTVSRICPAFLLAGLSCGCGASYVPASSAVLPATASDGTYPLRSDLMVVKLLDGAPKRWPANGFPPLRSASDPSSTPDRDIADELRKQFGKNILDPARDLTVAQAGQLARMLEQAFGTPAAPLVRVVTWEELVRSALLRP